MRKKIVAGNWKMNKTPKEAAEFCKLMKEKVVSDAIEVVFCVPFVDLYPVLEELKGTGIGVGAENMHFAESGAYTGEVSAQMLKEMGVGYVILGHSERRQYFGETDEMVNQKVKKALETGIVPILCCGETLEQREAGITIDVVEDGKTFEENAMKKAVQVMEIGGKITLSDDSGLEIDYMDKAPGIYSARFMGEDTPYPERFKAIFEKLNGVPEEKRTARFVSCIAAAFPDGRRLVSYDTVEGIIGYEAKGENGFGYDPIFYVPEKGKYMAELSSEEKNAISHRGKALRKMKEMLKKEL